jgi:kumamolisin
MRRMAALPRGSVTGAVVSRDELARLYGADPVDAERLRDAVTRLGLQVTQIDLAARRLKVGGTAGDLSRTFGTTLRRARSPHPSVTGLIEHRYRQGPLFIPAELDGIIVAVLGLDNRLHARPHVSVPAASSGEMSYPPNQVAQIYEFPHGTTGAGQVIAVIELGGGFSASDLDTYFASLGITAPQVTAVSVDGMANTPGGSADLQVLADIEVAGTVCPGAAQVVYFAPNTEQGLVDAVIDAVYASPTPTALCISWGRSETAWTAQALSAFNQAVEDAAALGVTVCVAAGHDGSDEPDGRSYVDFPASSPYCLACGGTTLRIDPRSGTVVSETVWDGGPDGGAGGGGVSAMFAQPEWQAGVGVPSGGRGVPDVAGNADPATGYLLFVNGKSVVAGGTGAVASLWAGLICRMAQAAGQPFGLIQQSLYAGVHAGMTAPGFRDITSGTNGDYSAVPGWDPCTGLGVPVGEDLLTRLTSGLDATLGTGVEAGYDSDDIGSTDWLGVTADVNILAALIASSRTLPPLSVGLFGDWGTGKSFFMRCLEDRVTILANAARAAASATPPRPSFFCRYVAQITFNAWHYVEADLWASLATRVFEGLSNYLQIMHPSKVPGQAYRDLISQLETSRAVLAEAEKRRDAAEATLRSAKQRLQGQIAERDSRSLAQLESLQPELRNDVQRLTDTLGLEQVRDVQDIRNHGRLRLGWQVLRHHRVGRARWLLVLASSVVAAALLLAWFLARDKPLAATVASAGALLTGALTALTMLLAGTRVVMASADHLVRAKDQQEQDSINALKREVEQATARTVAMEEEVARVQQLEFPTLASFIQERASSSDYRRHLGLVALIQRDFQALSDILTAASRRPAAGYAPKAQLPPVDRIVLYIDDLDRCPPSTVVQVLQAVHLLLAFPLFVVVVGVDSRWLVRSLEHEYDAIVSPEQSAEDRTRHAGELDATPHNYLEKIFQIPFWLRPMTPDGYGRLIRAVASNPALTSTGTTDARAETGAPAPGAQTSGPEPGPDSTEAAPPSPPAALDPGPSAASIDLTPNALIIADHELAYAEKLAPLIPTPRAAKRLINLYRLLKVSLDEEESTRLDGGNSEPGEYQAALLMLAILVGAPTEADTVFRVVRGHHLDDWAAVVDELRPQPWDDRAAPEHHSRAMGQLSASGTPRWYRLCQILDQVGIPATAQGLQPFRSWAIRVGRYSFSASWAASGPEPPEEQTEPLVQYLKSQRTPADLLPGFTSHPRRNGGDIDAVCDAYALQSLSAGSAFAVC